jgi:dolichyl-phosphate-mannose--protein O-mannosyl transferase
VANISESSRNGRPWSVADTLAIAILTALAGGIRGFRLANLPFIYSDELFYAREACNYVFASRDACGIPLDAISGHPPLGKWLISLGVRALGWDPVGWRVAGVIAGALTVALLYVLARIVLRSTRGATIVAGLLAIDFLHVVQSRIAMLDVFLTLFVVASFACIAADRAQRAAQADGSHARRGGGSIGHRPWLIAAGIMAGGAIATKWVGILALGGVAILAVTGAPARTGVSPRPSLVPHALQGQWLSLVVALVIVPMVAYVVTYLPRIDRPLLTAPWVPGSWVRGFVAIQREMLLSHVGGAEVRAVGTTNPSVSPAWSWPLLKRPMIYYSEPVTGDRRQVVTAMGSPVVWWSALLAVASLAWQWLRGRRSEGATVALVGFAALYGPLLIVSAMRSATFIYYFLPAVPFMCLALGVVALRVPARLASWCIPAFAIAAVASFAFFYPVITGAPIGGRALEARQWFRDCRSQPGTLAPAGWCWM